MVSAGSALISGNPVGSAILRAIVAAILFSGAGTAVQLLISAFLPELDQLFVANVSASSRETGEQESGNEVGQSVDILVEDEELDSMEFSDRDSGSVGYSDDGQEYEMDAASGSDEGLEELASDDLVVEAAESRGDSGVVPADPADSVDPGLVDSLPDVGGFADSFDAPETIGASNESTSRNRSVDHDPAMMAKALQTVLKRDT